MVPLGTYEHYKGGHYEVIANGLNEADETPVVIYRALYMNEKSTVWVRPESSFIEVIEVGGKVRPRFILIENEHASSDI